MNQFIVLSIVTIAFEISSSQASDDYANDWNLHPSHDDSWESSSHEEYPHPQKPRGNSGWNGGLKKQKTGKRGKSGSEWLWGDGGGYNRGSWNNGESPRSSAWHSKHQDQWDAPFYSAPHTHHSGHDEEPYHSQSTSWGQGWTRHGGGEGWTKWDNDGAEGDGENIKQKTGWRSWQSGNGEGTLKSWKDGGDDHHSASNH